MCMGVPRCTYAPFYTQQLELCRWYFAIFQDLLSNLALADTIKTDGICSANPIKNQNTFSSYYRKDEHYKQMASVSARKEHSFN